MLGALESVGPPTYADALKHEQVCRIAPRHLAPEPLGREDLARGTDEHLRQVEREAGRCWREWQRALHRDGIGVVSGAMLLRSLTLGGLYEQWSYTCAVRRSS